MSRAVIQDSDRASVEAAKAAIDRHFADRNAYFQANPKRAGRKIWGQETTPSEFSASNNCKDRHRCFFAFWRRPREWESRRMIDLLGMPSTRSAVISGYGKYRYHLFRKLGESRRAATFIMLNPSTADHQVDDPTIRKVMGFARRWGCDELHVVNLFAFRATKPGDLREATDPVGPENRAWLRRAVDLARDGLVMCAWGTHGAYLGQDKAVLRWIGGYCRPMCLGMTRGCHPTHPLYVPHAAELTAFNPA
jgi:hypothetical protein